MGFARVASTLDRECESPGGVDMERLLAVIHDQLAEAALVARNSSDGLRRWGWPTHTLTGDVGGRRVHGAMVAAGS